MSSQPDGQATRPILALTAGAVCISFAPIFVKLIEPGEMGPTAIAFWRCLFGAIVLAVIVRLSGRKFWLGSPTRTLCSIRKGR